MVKKIQLVMVEKNKKILLSGVKPTGRLHIGNYFGALCQFVDLQDKFDSYVLSGDMVNWLAKINIPAISVLLATHDDMEWDNNLAGVKAILLRYAK